MEELLSARYRPGCVTAQEVLTYYPPNMAPPQSGDITSGVSKISLKNTGKAKPKKAEPVADSWEDEEVSSESESETKTEKKMESKSKGFGAELESWGDDNDSDEERAPSPPPSRSRKPEPSTSTSVPPFLDFTGPGGASSSASTEYKRPEKTDAVARRMIAGALGLKAPKLTEEQKAYDRALREKERKRKEEERERKKRAEEEAAKAKAAIWDD
ncbi:hypothetical protein B0T20DRAFT_352706 [Sordaria brevicollis]|uniref:Uncharacterized protein n=1 Tax=Sordaria brevicollis TaxID=83679 RepID=A0AAE0UCP5_SORBR|nr:hypothetical protein B0T20DRAFT_352706 [Sordaria brevicollis]